MTEPARNAPPIPMRLPCPSCGVLHIDEGEFATKAHHTHACQACGSVWRPAVVATVGVRFLPGFQDDEPTCDRRGSHLVAEMARSVRDGSLRRTGLFFCMTCDTEEATR